MTTLTLHYLRDELWTGAFSYGDGATRFIWRKDIKVRCVPLEVSILTMAIQSKIPALPVDVVAYIIELCTVSTLSRLASASVLTDALVSKELDIRRGLLLAPFIADQNEFRRQLTEQDSVLSGSAIVALCSARNAFQPADLDIYVPSQKAAFWVQYLIEREGYHIQGRHSREEADREYQEGIGAVITMARESTHIDIVESLTVCATQPILHFWSTTVMVFMTGTGIGSLFPRLLEERRGLLSPQRTSHVLDLHPPDDGTIIHVLLAKYALRGFDVRHSHLEWARETEPSAVCHGLGEPACPQTIRWVDDRHTLTRSFGTVTERMTCVVLEGTLATVTTVWWLGGGSCGLPCTPAGTYVIPRIWAQARNVVE